MSENNISISSRFNRRTYSLKKITRFLEREGLIYDTTFYSTSGATGASGASGNTEISCGCCIYFPGTDIIMSVQTSPLIAGENFAQSSIMTDERMIIIPSLGYNTINMIINHQEPRDIINHIRDTKNAIYGRNSIDFQDITYLSDEYEHDNQDSTVEEQVLSYIINNYSEY
jgi:hypothetical protein